MKKIMSAVAATTLVLGLALVGHGATTGIECKVMAAKEDAVIIDCGKDAGNMEVGSKITLQTQAKTKKKAMVIEGC